MFSQIKPAQNRSHQIEDNVTRNKSPDMKKLLVNAQITAIISGIEGLGYFVVMIFYISGATRFGTFLSRLIIGIILPYLYLTNTRDNRERIIQEGWRAALLSFIDFRQYWKRPNNVVSITHGVRNPNDNVSVISNIASPECGEIMAKTTNKPAFQCDLNVPTNEKFSLTTIDDQRSKEKSMSNGRNSSACIKVLKPVEKLSVLHKRCDILDNLLFYADKEKNYLRLLLVFIHLESCKYEDESLKVSELIDTETIPKRTIILSNENNRRSRIERRKKKLKQLKNSLYYEDMYQKKLSDLVEIDKNFLDEDAH